MNVFSDILLVLYVFFHLYNMANLTSIHVQPVKAGSEQHNKREKRLDLSGMWNTP